MDPNSCWEELILAIKRDDRKEARDYAESLQAWLERGGFLPNNVSRFGASGVIAMALDPYQDWKDCGEGPWDSSEDADTFAYAEVGAPHFTTKGTDGKWRVFVKQ